MRSESENTFVVQIGNSDDKLGQVEWNSFVHQVAIVITVHASEVHYCGFSHSDAPWQNACWVFEMGNDQIDRFRKGLIEVKERFRQDSIAVTYGKTRFI